MSSSQVPNKSFYFHLFSDRTVNSFKVALACLLVLIYMIVTGFSSGQWTLVTIIVVMCGQPNLGGQFQKAYARLAGTLIGAFCATVVVMFFGQNPLPLIFCTFFLIIVFSYAPGNSEKSRAAGSLGAITFVLITTVPSPSFSLALTRTFEITLGIFIALTLSKLIFPIHAKKRLLLKIATSLEDLKELYQSEHLPPEKRPQKKKAVAGIASSSLIQKLHHFLDAIQDLPADPGIDLDQRITENLTIITRLIDEAEAESASHFKREVLVGISNNLHHIFRATSMLSFSLKSPEAHRYLEKLLVFKELNAEIIAVFDYLIAGIRQKNFVNPQDPVIRNLEETEKEISALSHDISFEHAVALHTTLACTKYFIQELHKLTSNIKKLS